MASEDKVFHFSEVAKHNHKKNCWIIISGKVYDVTPFLEEHPGGEEVLLLATEKDATEDFEDVGHSDSAREMMETYYVGKIDISTLPEKPNYKPSPQSTFQTHESNNDRSVVKKILLFLVPFFILGIAFFLQYAKNK